MDLNEDCKFCVLEHLDFSDLINVTEVNAKCQNVVGEVLKQTFAKKTLVFRWIHVLPNPLEDSNGRSSVNQQVKESRDSIEVSNDSLILKIVKYYGHLIQSLKVFFHSTIIDVEIAHISEFINRYCSNSLKSIHISIEKKVSINYAKPYIFVENLSLEGKVYHLSHSNLTFAEMFPSMRRLVLGSSRGFDLSLSEQNYLNLEHVEVDICDTVKGRFGNNALRVLLENNPQIKRFVKKTCSGRALHNKENVFEIIR